LNGKHVIIGRVVSGLEIIERVNAEAGSKVILIIIYL
jgi:cyclophilin family peptidyl-prolyl cis-trans isomerase